MKCTKNGDKDSTSTRPNQDAPGTIRQMPPPILARLLSMLTKRQNLMSDPDASNIKQVRLLIVILKAFFKI